ncbi:MAG: chalcone isomerase family protein [Ectothiorhodospiraceae bacterium]|nr:chalcone isomerase family protein [Ectothiorhodospiraceae bacterium]
MIKQLLMCALGCLVAVHALALPGPVEYRFPEMEAVGQGDLRWFGFNVYRATLWAPEGRYSPERPFALEIIYRRDFTADQLSGASGQELERLGYAPEDVSRWERVMRNIFPDVRSGERITGLADGNGGVLFYHDDRQVGHVTDPGFAEAFFAIWLDERTRNGRLRSALLGDSR